jgi:hypothetical protein
VDRYPFIVPDCSIAGGQTNIDGRFVTFVERASGVARAVQGAVGSLREAVG